MVTKPTVDQTMAVLNRFYDVYFVDDNEFAIAQAVLYAFLIGHNHLFCFDDKPGTVWVYWSSNDTDGIQAYDAYGFLCKGDKAEWTALSASTLDILALQGITPYDPRGYDFEYRPRQSR